VIRLDAARCELHFATPQWAAAPGQYAVFYSGEVCLGGAVIEQAAPLAQAGTRGDGPRRASAAAIPL
jgi:hypothetical protein